MPLPATPSPFRLSRRQPSTRRGAGPQFANSPRFLFSQSTPQNADKDTEINDDEIPSSTDPAGSTPTTHRNVIPPRSQRDVIVDSDDGELPRSTSTQLKASDLAYDIIDSSPPSDSQTPGALDTEYEGVLEPVRDSNKRRRTLGGGFSLSPAQEQEQVADETSSSTPEGPQNPITAPPATPAPRSLPGPALPNSTMQATAGIPTRSTGFGTLTPASTRTPFRSQPRFMFSEKKPPNSQPTLRAETPAASYPISTPAEKRKPTFVLPPSPTPKDIAEDIPAPFSPSSRSLRRRGRPRSGDSSYAPRGMAAEVRSWILDMGAKREQTRYIQSDFDENTEAPDELSQYILTARVVSASQTTLSSSGPLAFLQVEPVQASSRKDDDLKTLHILAMGIPKAKPQSSSRSSPVQIKAGDLLGFHRGLAWDVDLHGPGGCKSSEDLHNVLGDTDLPKKSKQRWLVAMEWDLIKEAA